MIEKPTLFSPRLWELQRIFLRSKMGFTPVILTCESGGPRNKPVRKWQLFANMMGMTMRDLLVNTSHYLTKGPSGKYWRRNGFALDDVDILEWIKGGCENAVTLEQLLEANSGLQCTGFVTDGEGNPRISNEVRTTKQLDAWIRKSKGFGRLFTFSSTDILNLPKPDPLFDAGRKVLIETGPINNCGSSNVFRGFYHDGRAVFSSKLFKQTSFSGMYYGNPLTEDTATETAIILEDMGLDVKRFVKYPQMLKYRYSAIEILYLNRANDTVPFSYWTCDTVVRDIEPLRQSWYSSPEYPFPSREEAKTFVKDNLSKRKDGKMDTEHLPVVYDIYDFEN